MIFSLCGMCPNVHLRASKTSEPSKTPVSVTQSLSSLRLTYARLLEENGSNVAMLRRREAELEEVEAQLREEEQATTKLRHELELVKVKADRFDNRAQLAERDVGFLKAMVVRVFCIFGYYMNGTCSLGQLHCR